LVPQPIHDLLSVISAADPSGGALDGHFEILSEFVIGLDETALDQIKVA
jgi:hypothetical protein